jgi:acyl carrier protein
MEDSSALPSLNIEEKMDQSMNEQHRIETGEIVRGVLISVLGLGIERSELDINADLFELGMDSLSVVRVVVALEEGLAIQIPADELSPDLFRRVGDLIDFLITVRAALQSGN